MASNIMKTYRVTLQEMISKTFDIQADSIEEALKFKYEFTF